MAFRCPICGFTTMRLFALRAHARRSHVLVKCPVCGEQHKGLEQHFFSQSDIEHLVYCYLFSTYKIPYRVRLAIKKKLEVQ